MLIECLFWFSFDLDRLWISSKMTFYFSSVDATFMHILKVSTRKVKFYAFGVLHVYFRIGF